MSLAYFKRFRMEISLTGWLFPCPALPRDYCLLPWDDDLVEAHSAAKYLSFRHEIDASVFPCLGQRDGCQRLMAEIAHRETFVPEATWLLACRESGMAQVSYCGTVQGLRSDDGLGAVQNLGIIPGHRGQGLGTYLLMRAVQGFRSTGLRHAYLEVTADNERAVRLYRRLGFRKTKTLYRAVEVAYA